MNFIKNILNWLGSMGLGLLSRLLPAVIIAAVGFLLIQIVLHTFPQATENIAVRFLERHPQAAVGIGGMAEEVFVSAGGGPFSKTNQIPDTVDV